MNEIQNSLFEAMKVFAETAAANSESTITIQGAITEVSDAGKGEYLVEYLGNTFSAYANSNVAYSVGDVVYVLVPDGDFSKNKVILSLVNPTSETFVNDADTTKIYYEISDNLIDKNFGIIKMSSYGTTQVTNQNITNYTTINFAKIIKEYLEKYRTFSLSFMTQTSMVIDQQNSGNYGISIKIPLIENAASGNGETRQTSKVITLDTGNILGNPYRLTEWAPQSVYFSIDEQYQYDSSKVPTISYFCYGFNQDASKTNIKDIWLKDISLNVVDVLTDADTTGYKLTLKASEGEYFATNYKTTKTITPTLRVNGKTTSIKKAEIYWFIEDAEVKIENKYYSPYGGYGWKCLNERTNIAMNSDGTETYDYITNATTWSVTQNEVKTSARYKCVVIHNGVESSAIITLKNLETTKILELAPTLGSNVFVKDTGYVDLTATVYIRGVTEYERNKAAVVYSWMRYDKNGKYIQDDDNFFELISYNSLVRKEVAGSTVDCFETKVRYPVNKIEEVNNIFCSAKYVYLDNGNPIEELIGTQSVMVTTSTDFTYNLIINNADQLYKYDSDGDSPAGSAYDGPSTSKVTSIPALTYTIRKANGEELSNEEYCYVKYTWIVPKSSLFTITKQSGTGTYSEDDNYYYFNGYDTYKHTASLAYGIATRFNVGKAKSKIILKVEFQGTTIEREVPITFMKEGMSGSNGTAYAAELVSGGLSASTSDPYGTLMANGVAKKLKFVYNISNGTLYHHDYETNTLRPWASEKRRIYPRVYFNGVIISDFTVEYSMFDKSMTNPCFYIYNVDGVKGAQLELSKTPNLNETYCNIVQAKITPQVNNGQASISNSNQILYCYYPIELTVTNFVTGVVPSVDGGFAEVMYASDGTNPSWDETSAFVCNDDALIDGNLSDFFTITWNAQHHLKPSSGSGKTFTTKPDNKYDDGNSKNLVTATLKFRQDKYTWLNTEIARLRSENYQQNTNITTYNSNLQYLRNFASAYQGTKWNNELAQIQKMLDKQTNAVYRLNTLLETSLVNIDNYMNTQQAYNKSNIKSVCASLISQVSTLKSETQRAVVKIQRLNGTSGYTFNDLISLVNYMISWNSAIKDNYVQQLGLDSTITLQLLVEDINRQIDEYQAAYRDLMQLSSSGFDSIYRSIQTDIENMCNQIPNSAMTAYVNLRDKCRAYANNFNSCTSIKDIKQCITDMYNYVLRGTFYLSGTTLSVNAATNSEFAARVQRCNEAIAANNATITNYTNILNTNNMSIVHHRPIVLYFNRYEMSNINAWDGNKIETGDGSYLLAPQVGAGIKESDNSFTGIVMGLKNISGNTSSTYLKKGLFGYYKGEQTICLDASNGSAIFGKSGTGGQIIIDPATTDAMLYSSNFFKNYDKYTGLPTSYGTGNYNKQGMMINLSKPEIRFGNGNFVVDKDGNTTIAGTDNNIGGWKVTDTQIHSNRTQSNGRITLDSGSVVDYVDAEGTKHYKSTDTGKLFSHYHSTLTSTGNGFYLSADGLSLGSKIKITNDGVIKAGTGAVAGTGKHWTIDGGTESYIGYGTTSFDSSNLDNVSSYSIGGGSNQVYIGTNGIRLGNKFAVDSNGNLVTKHLIAKTGGNIGGWTIGTNSLSASNITINANGSIETDGFSDGGSGWKISSNGYAYFNWIKANNSGYIGGWTINGTTLKGGNTTLNSNGTITCDTLYASQSGTIGGWTISADSLSTTGGGGITLGTSGITGQGFTLNSNGLGFTKGTIGLGSTGTGNNGISYNNSGMTVSGTIHANAGVIGGCSISNGTLTVKNGNIESLDIGKLTMEGKKVNWSTIKCLSQFTGKVGWYTNIDSVVTDCSLSGNKTDGYTLSKSRITSVGNLLNGIKLSFKTRQTSMLGNSEEDKEWTTALDAGNYS